MRIEQVKLYNYRLFKGYNQLTFPKDDIKNIFIIYGENGFGKTTLLQSLMWCLYGRMVIDVDDLSRSEIISKGYENYLKGNLNFDVGRDSLLDDKSYYVEILISELRIPTMPSADLLVKRSYDVSKNKEVFELFIDGHENELARQIGYDIFVNDFVLNKDIARLFFFDSERIVKLAEGQSKEERIRLGSAYNHVIGIKKYEDLKSNLEGILSKIKRDALDGVGKAELNRLTSEIEEIEGELIRIESAVSDVESSKEVLKQELDSVLTQLLREGSMVDLDSKQKAVEEREICIQRNEDFRSQLKDYLDYVPFAIAGSLFREATQVAERDFKVAESRNMFFRQNETIIDIKSRLENMISKSEIASDWKKTLLQQMESILSDYQVASINAPVLLNIDKETYNHLLDVKTMLYTSSLSEFKTMLEEYKRNRQRIDRLNKIIHRSSDEDANDRIVFLKNRQEAIQENIKELDTQLLDLSVSKVTKTIAHQKLLRDSKRYQASMQVSEKNREKSDLTNVLIKEISDYLTQLRAIKNKSIELRIKRTLNTLMHKNDFVDSIQMEMEDGVFDVRLFSGGREIQKNSLSKGEQQLYATALLLALVEESGIEFPVFIDSPLQKFDKKHAERVITDFYPQVSSQVVILPIFEKELTEEEEILMKSMVKSKYRILNDGMHSRIEEYV